MNNLRPGSGERPPYPQLPSFSRSRRPISTTVRLSSLRQLQGLLWLLLLLQLSTVLLVLAGPAAAPLAIGCGEAPRNPHPSQRLIPVPSPLQP